MAPELSLCICTATLGSSLSSISQLARCPRNLLHTIPTSATDSSSSSDIPLSFDRSESDGLLPLRSFQKPASQLRPANLSNLRFSAPSPRLQSLQSRQFLESELANS
ncbi:hypothetical protein Sjap_013575 [Stephania japonica]|uniref:Uncharacterized protein n=1 Tax=Stephania japonica TaxID=461633 RepID=A0AAP0IYC1_9MAGN